LENDLGELHDVSAEHSHVVAEIERIAFAARNVSPLFPFPALDRSKP
jgi:hypothetical protein